MNEGNGRVSFYGFTSDYSEDFSGGSKDILIGGIDESAPNDNVDPEMILFMNDESQSGGITNNSPSLIVKLLMRMVLILQRYWSRYCCNLR